MTNPGKGVERITLSHRLRELQINGRSCTAWRRKSLSAKIDLHTRTEQSHPRLVCKVCKRLARVRFIRSFEIGFDDFWTVTAHFSLIAITCRRQSAEIC